MFRHILSVILLSPLLYGQFFTPPIQSELVTNSIDSQDYRSLKFTAESGYFYRLQNSANLSQWDDLFTIDGIGESISYPMTLLNGQQNSGNSNTDPVQGVMVSIQAVQTGGIVANWRSLESSTAIQVYIPGINLDAAWQTSPLRNYQTDDYLMLVVKHSDTLPEEPYTFSNLAPADLDFFTVFENEFPQISESAPSDIVGPPAGALGSKLFYRVTVEVGDIDSDGIPDLLETTPVDQGGTGSDPFNPDTDDDGVFDGAEVGQGSNPNDADSFPEDCNLPSDDPVERVLSATIEIKKINFHDSHKMTSDNMATTYGCPQWVLSSHNYPVAYSKGDAVKLSGRFEARESTQSISVEITGPDGMKLTGNLSQEGDSNFWTLKETSFDKGLKDEIQHYTRLDPDKEFKLDWKFTITPEDGEATEITEGTKHTVYVTHGDPIPGNSSGREIVQETAFDIATRYAAGLSTSKAGTTRLSIVKAIFVPFGAIHVPKVKPTTGLLLPDGMTYYNGGNPTQQECTTGTEMLKDPRGNGECTAWADLFSDVIRLHGFKGIRQEVTPAAAAEKKVLVNNVQFVGNIINNPNLGPYGWVTGINLRTHSPNPAPANLGGIFGQGSKRLAEPPKIFGNHFIVDFEGTLFDASYEGNPVDPPNAVAKYENAAFAGYGNTQVNPSTGQELHFFRKNNPGNTPEIKLTKHPKD